MYVRTTMSAYHECVIIGGGPGGLQMAYYLQAAGIDYLLCEAGEKVAEFFDHYPITRKLISFNKTDNPHHERSYALRFDWNSLLCRDPDLVFTRYSQELYPGADDLARYMRDFAERNELEIQYGKRVRVRLNGKGPRFTVIDQDGWTVECDIVFVATGATSEHIPNIPGAEHAVTYGEFMSSGVADNLAGKEVCIIGGGVSANEVAAWLRETNKCSLVRLHMRQAMQHAHQSHFAGDVRSLYFDADIWQFEMLHFWAEHPTRSLVKRPDGRIDVLTETPQPHWKTPQTVVAPVTYDAVILCTGFNFVDESLFENFSIETHNGNDRSGEEIPKPIGASGRFPALTAWWETSQSGLYYIGSAMQANDRVASSPFIRGFRYAVRTLFNHLRAERWGSPATPVSTATRALLGEQYDGSPLPTQQVECTDSTALLAFAQDIATFFSLTDSLPAMRSVFGDFIVFREDTGSFTWHHDIPIHAALSGHDEAGRFFAERTHLPPVPRLTGTKLTFFGEAHLFVLTMEYNRSNFPKRARTVEFTKPSDHAHVNCSYYLHPAIRYFRHGVYGGTLLLQESLNGRFDKGNDYSGFRCINPSRIYNFFLRCLGHSQFEGAEDLDEEQVDDAQKGNSYLPWTDEDRDYWNRRKHMIQTPCLYEEEV